MKLIRRYIIYAIIGSIVECLLLGSAVAQNFQRSFRSPRRGLEVVVTTDTATSSDQSESIGKREHGSLYPAKNLFRFKDHEKDYAGVVWLMTAAAVWINDRYLVAEEYKWDSSNLFIFDAIENCVLINARFAALFKNPTYPKWAAIQNRNRQDTRHEIQDVILIIDPFNMDFPLNFASAPFNSFQEVRPGGTIIGWPTWSSDGEVVAVAVWHNGKSEGILYSGDTLREKKRVPIDFKLSDDDVRSLQFVVPQSEVNKAMQDAGLFLRHPKDTQI